jgi:hypothetical protein
MAKGFVHTVPAGGLWRNRVEAAELLRGAYAKKIPPKAFRAGLGGGWSCASFRGGEIAVTHPGERGRGLRGRAGNEACPEGPGRFRRSFRPFARTSLSAATPGLALLAAGCQCVSRAGLEVA